MTALQELRCEVCGLVTANPTHWFVIRCGDSDLTVYRWNSENANAAGSRHYCGEAHAELVRISVRAAHAKFYIMRRRCQFDAASAARQELGAHLVLKISRS